MFLVLLNNDNYEPELFDMIKNATDIHYKICLILLKNLYKNILKDMTLANIPHTAIHFIDTLSSHYGAKKNTRNCTYIAEPKISFIMEAAEHSINNKGCHAVIIDNLSSLLFYHSVFDIQRLTHNMKTNDSYSKAKKIFFMPKKDELTEIESNKLLEDLKMFSDKVLII